MTPPYFGGTTLAGLVGTWGTGATRPADRPAPARRALRVYAADHNGTLPAALSEIALPLPVDPFTGKSFGDQRQGGTAHLRGGPLPRSRKKEPSLSTFTTRCPCQVTRKSR